MAEMFHVNVEFELTSAAQASAVGIKRHLSFPGTTPLPEIGDLMRPGADDLALVVTGRGFDYSDPLGRTMTEEGRGYHE